MYRCLVWYSSINENKSGCVAMKEMSCKGHTSCKGMKKPVENKMKAEPKKATAHKKTKKK